MEEESLYKTNDSEPTKEARDKFDLRYYRHDFESHLKNRAPESPFRLREEESPFRPREESPFRLREEVNSPFRLREEVNSPFRLREEELHRIGETILDKGFNEYFSSRCFKEDERYVSRRILDEARLFRTRGEHAFKIGEDNLYKIGESRVGKGVGEDLRAGCFRKHPEKAGYKLGEDPYKIDARRKPEDYSQACFSREGVKQEGGECRREAMPQGGGPPPPGGPAGDELGSTDEVKVFKDEGDGEDEKRSSENLLEEKSSLIDLTESEVSPSN